MQTFLPYPSFENSASCLDNKRLTKQLLEATQILGINAHKKAYSCKNCKETSNRNDFIYGCSATQKPLNQHKWEITPWYNHPAVVMWRGYNAALYYYTQELVIQNRKRGFNVMYAVDFIDSLPTDFKRGGIIPPWLGIDKFHNSHKSNLLRKDYDFYFSTQGWTNDLTVEYWWPTPDNMELYKKELELERSKNTFLLTEEIL